MNSHIFWLLVRLAILLGVLLVQSSEEATYEQFINKHIDPLPIRFPNLNDYCDYMMDQRELTTPECTPTNTFIKAHLSDVQEVCSGTQTGFYDSRTRFRLVVCRNTGSATQCQYRGQVYNNRVRLSCTNGQPTHFEGAL